MDEFCLTFTFSHSRRIAGQSQQSFSLLTVGTSFQITRTFSSQLQLLLPMCNTCYQVLIYLVASKRAVVNLMKELTGKKKITVMKGVLLLIYKKCI